MTALSARPSSAKRASTAGGTGWQAPSSVFTDPLSVVPDILVCKTFYEWPECGYAGMGDSG
ncbi:hypothetical protein GCM10027521_61930 [Amycolatopsis cihanbeyliensis]